MNLLEPIFAHEARRLPQVGQQQRYVKERLDGATVTMAFVCATHRVVREAQGDRENRELQSSNGA